MNELVLASASKYRKELLTRLGLPFTTLPAAIDEESEKDPALSQLAVAEKLAFLKAMSLAKPGRVVIGSDQLVALGAETMGKAHTLEKACTQLAKMQGKTHQLITAVCIVASDQVIPFTNITTLTMKKLTTPQIAKYVELDEPTDCAGSYKIELHGINLFEKIETDDFTAIQGLPLIHLSKVLHNLGYQTFGVL